MKKTPLLVGILLILVGALLLVMEFVPQLNEWIQWPMILVAVGLVFLVISVTTGNGDLAIPGMICAGLGGIFLYQSVYDDFRSWSYIWALIPGFIGLGILLSNLINRSRMDRGGVVLLIISVFAFAAFYAIDQFEAVTSDMIWPFALIFVGVMMLFNNITHRRVKEKNQDE
jgi:hypothetical protein